MPKVFTWLIGYTNYVKWAKQPDNKGFGAGFQAGHVQ